MDTIVKTKYGKLKGNVEEGILCWKGIPFAKPPVGELRFRAPVEPDSWEGIREAKAFGPTCPQIMPLQKEPENEDCLYLNVFSPNVNGNYPVLVFIHGGAFAGGSGSQYLYYGHSFAQHDIVVVTINYRLGAMGMFDFSSLDPSFVSNIALRDQVCALKWVNENIRSFGGNPYDVTIMGQSAGAISVISLLNIPESYPYYQKAIIMSCFPELVKTKEEGIESGRKLLEYLKITTKEELLAISAEELTKKTGKFMLAQERRWGLDRIMPVADGEFMTNRPLDGVRVGTAHYVPLLMGVTESEVDILFKLGVSKKIAATEINLLLEEAGDIKEELMTHYGKTKQNLLARDWLLKIPTEWYALEHAKRQNVWLYRFRYDNVLLKLLGLNSFHAIDLFFAFKNFENPLGAILLNFAPKFKAFKLADRLQYSLISFIKTGKEYWDTFNKDMSVKIFDINGDTIEKGANKSREIWNKSNLYKRWHP